MDESMMKRYELAKKHTLVLKITENWGHTKATIGEYQIGDGDTIKFQFPNGETIDHVVHMCAATKIISEMGNPPYDVHDKIPYVFIEYNGMKMPISLRHFQGVRVLDFVIAKKEK